MAIRASCAALLLSSLFIAGCGTVSNLVKSDPEEGGKSPFGGVRQDLRCIEKASNGDIGFGTHAKSEPEQYPQVALMMFCAADLPLSLIGDVVTWPYTATYTFINQPTPTPPVTLAPPIPAPPVAQAGRTHLIAQVVAAQGLAPLNAGAFGIPQVVVASRIASLDAAALAPPVTQAPAAVRPQTPPSGPLPMPRQLP